MGLPKIEINFTARAREVFKRADRGIVGMIFKDAAVPQENPVEIIEKDDIPSTLTSDHIDQIKLALVGYKNSPKKVIVYVLGSEAEDYTEALDYFSLHRVTYMCAPDADTDGATQSIAEWVKDQREKRNKVKAVLPDYEADSEGIINYATASVTLADTTPKAYVGEARVGKNAAGSKTYNTEKFCSRIAGLLAGTPAAMSSTYAILEDVVSCETKPKKDLDDEIDAGKFVLYYDGENVKVGRGVNSLTTVKDGQSNAWKKIKVVETMDTIHDDLVKMIQDNYIGKLPNNYDNRCLLLSAVMSYFQELVTEGLLSRYTVEFDIDAIKNYLRNEIGVDTSDMTEDEIKQADTDSFVFLRADCGVLDAIEDVTINITV